MSVSVRHEERERELVEIARLAREVAEQHPVEHPRTSRVVRVRRRRGRRVCWPLVVALGSVGGITVGLLVAVWLIPDQPDRVLVPVEQPAPSFHVDPEPGVRA